MPSPSRRLLRPIAWIGILALLATLAGAAHVDAVPAFAPSSTTITSSNNPSLVSQSVTFTATVVPAAPPGVTPTGTVSFLVDATLVAPAVPLTSSGQALFATSLIPAGTHTVTANYSGDPVYTPSSASLTQIVVYPSTTTVTASQSPVVSGQSVTYTAIVASSMPQPPGNPDPTGTVTFKVNATTSNPITLIPGGPGTGTSQATFTATSSAVGFPTVIATYSGDATYAASSGSLNSSQVQLAATTLSFTATGAVGSNIIFNAQVTPVTPGAGNPTGTVTFAVGGLPFATSTVSGSGTAQGVAQTLPLAFDTVTAAYSGDSKFMSSIAPSLIINLSLPVGTTVNYSTSSSGTTSTGSQPSSASGSTTVTVLNGIGNPAVLAITTGCSSVSLAVAPGTQTSVLAAHYSGAGLGTIWHYDNNRHLFLLAYSNVANAPLDVSTTVSQVDSYWFCAQSGQITSS